MSTACYYANRNNLNMLMFQNLMFTMLTFANLYQTQSKAEADLTLDLQIFGHYLMTLDVRLEHECLSQMTIHPSVVEMYQKKGSSSGDHAVEIRYFRPTS